MPKGPGKGPGGGGNLRSGYIISKVLHNAQAQITLLEILLKVGVVTTLMVLRREIRHRRRVQTECLRPGIEILHCNSLELNDLVANDWIVDSCSLEVEVLVILRFDESIRDVRNIVARIRLSGQIHLVTLHAECIYEILPEAHELVCHLVFVGDIWGTNRKAGTDWLVDPNHVGKIGPREGVLPGFDCTWLVQDRPVLEHQACR